MKMLNLDVVFSQIKFKITKSNLLLVITFVVIFVGIILRILNLNEWMLLVGLYFAFCTLFIRKYFSLYNKYFKNKVSFNFNDNTSYCFNSREIFRPFRLVALIDYIKYNFLHELFILTVLLAMTAGTFKVSFLIPFLEISMKMLWYLQIFLFTMPAITSLFLFYRNKHRNKQKISKLRILENKVCRLMNRDSLIDEMINHYSNLSKTIDQTRIKTKNKRREIVNQIYQAANLEPPKKIIWYDSPVRIYQLCKLELDSVNLPSPKKSFIWDCFWDLISRENLYHNFNSHISNIRNLLLLTEILYIPSPFTLVGTFWSNIVEEAIIERLEQNSISSSQNYDLFNDFGSCLIFSDEFYLAYYQYCIKVLELNKYALAKPLLRLSNECYCFLPSKNVILLSRKPIKHTVDDLNLLHNDLGAAMVFADGFEVYAIHGVKVSKQVVVAPHKQTISQIREETNVEVKRIRIERYGWSKFIEAIDAKIIDSQSIVCSQEVTWLETLYYSEEDNLCALFTYDPSTGRPYILEVDPKCTTCESAQRYLLSPENIMNGTEFNFKINTYPKLRT